MCESSRPRILLSARVYAQAAAYGKGFCAEAFDSDEFVALLRRAVSMGVNARLGAASATAATPKEEE